MNSGGVALIFGAVFKVSFSDHSWLLLDVSFPSSNSRACFVHLPFESVGKELLLERHALLVRRMLKLLLSSDRIQQNFKLSLRGDMVLVAQL